MVKDKEIGRIDIFTKNIMKKAQNDIDFIPSIMNRTISDAQKYFSLDNPSWTAKNVNSHAFKVSIIHPECCLVFWIAFIFTLLRSAVKEKD